MAQNKKVTVLPEQLKLYYIKYENICKNKINKLWSLKFSQIYIKENL